MAVVKTDFSRYQGSPQAGDHLEAVKLMLGLLCVDDTKLSWGRVWTTVFGTPSSGMRFLGHGDLVLITRCLTEPRLQELVKQGYFLLNLKGPLSLPPPK